MARLGELVRAQLFLGQLFFRQLLSGELVSGELGFGQIRIGRIAWSRFGSAVDRGGHVAVDGGTVSSAAGIRGGQARGFVTDLHDATSANALR